MDSAFATALREHGKVVRSSLAINGCRCLLPGEALRKCVCAVVEAALAPVKLSAASRTLLGQACAQLTRASPAKALFTVHDVQSAIAISSIEGMTSLPRGKLTAVDAAISSREDSRRRRTESCDACDVLLLADGCDPPGPAGAISVSEGGNDGCAIVPPQEQEHRRKRTAPQGRNDAANNAVVLASVQGMSVEELQGLVVSLSAKLHDTTRQRDTKTKRSKRDQERFGAMQQRIRTLEMAQLQLIVPGRNPTMAKRRYMVTLAGTYKLAYKQTLGYGGVIPTLKIIEVPVSRWTVTRAEQILTANVLSQSSSFYSEMYAHLLHYLRCLTCPTGVACAGGVAPLSWELHVAKGDGSNAHTLRSSKVFVSMFTAIFSIPGLENPDIDDDDEDKKACRVKAGKSTWPDLGIIPEHCTAAASRQLWVERFSLLGCHSWDQKMAATCMADSQPLGGAAGPPCRVEDCAGLPTWVEIEHLRRKALLRIYDSTIAPIFLPPIYLLLDC